MRKKIYLDIIHRLKAARLGIEYFSLWNNDLYSLEKRGVFATPAVFVEFGTIEWSQLQNRARGADLQVRLHIVTKSYATAEDGNPYQDLSLEHLELIEKIDATLQGFQGEGFNHFMLTESVPDHDHTELLHHEECFITHITDFSAQKLQERIPVAQLKISQ